MRQSRFTHREKGHDVWHRRALLKAMGYREKDISKPPWIAVVHGWSEVGPGHYHLRDVAQKVKDGIWSAGGTPAELPIPGICGSVSGGAPDFKFNVPYRDFASSLLETFLRLCQFDGAVLIPSCDHVIPAYLQAAARVNIPAIVVTGGYMSPGEYKGRMVLVHDTMRSIVRVQKGEITEKEAFEITEAACPTPGACPIMGTANTMAAVTEALGMSLPGNASLPAVLDNRLLRLARTAGEKIVELVEQDVRPSSIMTLKAFRNAISIVQAIGGSTNALIHLPAIARELGINLDINLWNSIGDRIPFICSISPNRIHLTMRDLDRAGGIIAVLKELLPLIEGDALTVSGATLSENVKDATVEDRNIIRSIEDPFEKRGAIIILKGSLAPEGAVVKASAIAAERRAHKGPARVFDSEDEAIDAVLGGRIQPGQVLVVRYEGPRGGPGGLELMKLKHHMTMMGMDRTNALITDGRLSGGNYGLAICHVSPEAMIGGPIALVRDGDEIEIDIPARKVELHVKEEELERRRGDWKPPKAKVDKGALALYASLANSFSEGASIFP